MYCGRNHPTIRLNFEDLHVLDHKLVNGYKEWVKRAPENWKADGFITRNSPIIVTSRYGQNARIALDGHEDEEAATWNAERDYSKVAYLTFALATSIK
jgi:hypothetical protein